MDIVIVIIELLLAMVIWWDCTVQLKGLNYELYENRSEWRKKGFRRNMMICRNHELFLIFFECIYRTFIRGDTRDTPFL